MGTTYIGGEPAWEARSYDDVIDLQCFHSIFSYFIEYIIVLGVDKE